jgi:hypothetical protein
MQSGHHSVVVVVTVIVLCGSRSHLLCCLGCHSHGCCTTWGVAVAVVVPCGCCGCGVVVAAFVLHAVLRLWEGEVGRVSVEKGGGRWKVGVLHSEVEKKKKLHTISE